MQYKINTLRKQVESYTNDIADLNRQYGTGSRPAWVGEEIGTIRMFIERTEAKIAELVAVHGDAQ